MVIDPVSQITFDADGREFRGQAEFARRLASLAASTGVHVVLVAHTVKGGGKNAGGADPMDLVQGSAMFTRLAHNVMTIARHDPKDSHVFSSMEPTVRHATTVTLAKCRNGFSGSRYAFELGPGGPVFRELGLIKPR